MKLNFLALGLMQILCVTSLSGQSQTEAFFENLLQTHDIPGLSVAIIENGKILYHAGHGVRANDTQVPVSTETIFSAASLSKLVFAYAVMKLVEAGDLDLDKPLHEYWEYPDLEHDERYKRITARRVLSHSSGLPNWRRGQLATEFEPGERFQYSGEGFVYLMKVVEHLQGQEINQLAEELVYQPLGMTNTSYTWEDRFEENYAAPHDFTGFTLAKRKRSESNVAYSLQTTAEDYAKFMVAVMNGEGLKKKNTRTMLSGQIPVTEEGNLFWSLGWGIQKTEMGKAIWQWGDNGTFKAFTMAYPEKGKGVVFLANTENGLRIVPEVVKYVFSDEECPAFDWMDYQVEDAPHQALLKSILQKGYDKAIVEFLHENQVHHDTTLISQSRMRRVGDRLMQEKRYADAQKVYLSNVLAFASFEAYVQYADACLQSGEVAEAKSYYQKAIALKPGNERVQTVLDQLTPATNQANVEFRLNEGRYRHARLITLVGDFNNWEPITHLFSKQNGEWICRIALPPGTYHYQVVIDGVWTLDPENPHTGRNDQGRVCSVLMVP